MADNSTIIVEYTEIAQQKLQEVLKEHNSEGNYLRISVVQRENGGFGYEFGIEGDATENDEVIESNIKTLVDRESVPLLQGSRVDYVEGMQRSGFVVSNPNAGGCACGGGGCCGGGG